MCYSDPMKSLAIARERMTPEAWAKFETEFQNFCAVSGMLPGYMAGNRAEIASTIEWAKWAFLSARPSDLVLTDWFSCTTPPVRDGWFDVQRGGYASEMPIERVRFTVANGWDRESCQSQVAVWFFCDSWRGIQGEEA